MFDTCHRAFESNQDYQTEYSNFTAEAIAICGGKLNIKNLETGFAFDKDIFFKI